MLLLFFYHYICRKLIELKEKENGPDHLSVAKAVNNLAVIYCLKVR